MILIMHSNFTIKALKIDPNHFNCLNNIGLVNRELKEVNEAISNYNQSLKIFNENSFITT